MFRNLKKLFLLRKNKARREIVFRIGCLGFKPEKDNPYPLCEQSDCLLRYVCDSSTYRAEEWLVK